MFRAILDMNAHTLFKLFSYYAVTMTIAYADDLGCFDGLPNQNLYGLNDKTIESADTAEVCKQACLSEKTFQCLSFDYIEADQLCFLSTSSAQTAPEMFGAHSSSVYYERVECREEEQGDVTTQRVTTPSVTTYEDNTSALLFNHSSFSSFLADQVSNAKGCPPGFWKLGFLDSCYCYTFPLNGVDCNCDGPGRHLVSIDDDYELITVMAEADIYTTWMTSGVAVQDHNGDVIWVWKDGSEGFQGSIGHPIGLNRWLNQSDASPQLGQFVAITLEEEVVQGQEYMYIYRIGMVAVDEKLPLSICEYDG